MSTKAELARAFRMRAGVIGVLQSCLCTYPLEQHETESGHAENCPSHAMTLSARAARSPAAYIGLGFDLETPSDIVHGGGG